MKAWSHPCYPDGFLLVIYPMYIYIYTMCIFMCICIYIYYVYVYIYIYIPYLTFLPRTFLESSPLAKIPKIRGLRNDLQLDTHLLDLQLRFAPTLFLSHQKPGDLTVGFGSLMAGIFPTSMDGKMMGKHWKMMGKWWENDGTSPNSMEVW